MISDSLSILSFREFQIDSARNAGSSTTIGWRPEQSTGSTRYFLDSVPGHRGSVMRQIFRM